jgi:hypothetical protein
MMKVRFGLGLGLAAMGFFPDSSGMDWLDPSVSSPIALLRRGRGGRRGGQGRGRDCLSLPQKLTLKKVGYIQEGGA